jgi:hypothetical protein
LAAPIVPATVALEILARVLEFLPELATAGIQEAGAVVAKGGSEESKKHFLTAFSVKPIETDGQKTGRSLALRA